MATPTAPADLLPKGRILGGCEIVRLLGKGGMGVVYEAVQLSLRRRVALKVLSPRLAKKPRFVARFDRESVSLANLAHPHIVSIFDRGVDGELFFFTMEYVAGESLRDRMDRGRLPLDETWRYLDEMLSALGHAHARGVVHRDVKPENVLLDAEARVKVADFGIAHLERTEEAELPGGAAPIVGNLTVGSIGTPKYMAPEQKARRKSDHRADLYAAGVVGFEMLTRRLPENEAEALSSLPAEVPPPVGRFLWRLLAPDARDRFPSAGAAREALAAAIRAPAGGAEPATPGKPETPSAGASPALKRLALPATFLVCIAAALYLGIALARPDRGPTGAGNVPANATTPPRNSPAPTNTVAPPANTARPPDPKVDPGKPTPVAHVDPPANTAPTAAKADADALLRAAWNELGTKVDALLAHGDWGAAHATLEEFRARHELSVKAEPALSKALAERFSALEDAARRDLETRQTEAARLREAGKYLEALAALEHPGGFGSADLDEAAEEFRRRTARVACDGHVARARAQRDAGKLRDALVAFREGLAFSPDAAVVLALNGEIAALKRSARDGLTDVLDKLALFARNGRYDLPDALAKLEKDPERAELIPFVKSVRDDLESFKQGAEVPREMLAQWSQRLDRTPVTLGDRADLPAGERCERCEGRGGDPCARCSQSGRVLDRCDACAGTGTATCPKCRGRREADCEICLGKGTVPKRTRTKCTACAQRRCSDCKGTGFIGTFGMCGRCGGDGRIGTPGRVGDTNKTCPECKGAQTIQSTEQLPCTSCDSKGRKTCSHCHGAGTAKCLNCDGSGKASVVCPECAGAGDQPCPKCKGAGRRPAR